MSEALTATERKVYQYLIDYLTEHTYQPSVREIGKKFRIKSTKTVSEVLHSLAKKGYVERDPSRSRGVKLLGYSGTTRVQPVPYYGRIAAGEPALLPEYRAGFITMDRRFVPTPDTFFMRVKGNSMLGKCIFDGDYIMVKPCREAEEGDIVAALLGDEATVKTFTRRGGTIVLEASNPADNDIVVKPGDKFSLLGIACGVFRPMHDNQPSEADASLS
ncbi:MAG: transcriptional repressor LexA [Gemmatimonadaceae bacterium]